MGERPEDEPGPAEDARSHFVALCVVARLTPIDPVQIVSAYVHPCASMQRVMLVDSDYERQTLILLLQFQRQMARQHQAAVIIDKPMESIGPQADAAGVPCPPLIPDFIVTARYRDGGERRVAVETMGYADKSPFENGCVGSWWGDSSLGCGPERAVAEWPRLPAKPGGIRLI